MTDVDARAEDDAIAVTYDETERERVLAFAREGDDRSATAVIAQNREGYAMLAVRPSVGGDDLERYYGLDVALDHAAELLGVPVDELSIPEAAEDMGM